MLLCLLLAKKTPKALNEKHFKTRENVCLGNQLNMLSPNEYFLALGHYSLFLVQLVCYINLNLVSVLGGLGFWWLVGFVCFLFVLFK